jgi:hypothetical protein
MHVIQAQVLASIVNFIQDKAGVEPELEGLVEDGEHVLHVRLIFMIGRDYPGMKPEEAEKP